MMLLWGDPEEDDEGEESALRLGGGPGRLLPYPISYRCTPR